jgi:hypothetical protein
MTKRQANIQMSKPISVQCNSIYVVQVQIDIVRTIQFEYLVFLFVCVVSSNHAIGYKCRNRVTCSHYNSLALSSGLVSSRGDRDKHSLVSVSEHSSGRHTLSLSVQSNHVQEQSWLSLVRSTVSVAVTVQYRRPLGLYLNLPCMYLPVLVDDSETA